MADAGESNRSEDLRESQPERPEEITREELRRQLARIAIVS
jgi:hypothetical protein